MRSVTAAMADHLAGRGHSRAWMLRLDLRDGTIIGLTSLDQDVAFDLGDAAGLVTYQARTGAKISDVELVAGLAPSNFEVSGPFAELVTLEAVLGGRFNRAQVRLFQVNWRRPGDGALKMLLGNLTDAKPQGGEFLFEVRSEADKFNQSVGRVLSPLCWADYGDVFCGATVETVVGTVTSVTDEFTLTLSYAGSFADDYFNFGTVEALTGELTGTDPVEIYRWAVGGQVVLYAPLAEQPQVGDTFTVKRGCPKNRTACIDRGRMAFFRGQPDIPGTDQILRPTIPGQGNEV